MPSSSRQQVGIAALVATVMLWSAFALVTRFLGETSLTSLDGDVIRFGVPALLLLPWWPAAWRGVRAEEPATIALLLLAGIPHFLLFAWGAHLTSAGLTGLLVPGTVPLFVTLLLVATGGPRPDARRATALGLIVVGVAATAALMGAGSALGIGVLLTSGLVWAGYTLGLARTRLTLPCVVVIISIPSALAGLVLAALRVMPSHLMEGSAAWGDVALLAVTLGVGTGLVSTFCYATAVRTLGGSLPAVAGAASPVVTALVAVPLLGEPITPGLACGLVLIASGVLAFNLLPKRACDTSDDSSIDSFDMALPAASLADTPIVVVPELMAGPAPELALAGAR